MDGPDPGTGQQRDDRLRDHGQVDRHAVALGHAQGLEGVRGLLHFLGQLRIGVGAGVPGLAFEVDRDPVPAPGLDMAVQGVIGGIDLAADEPLRERRIRPVQGLREVLGPAQQPAGLLRPERRTVGIGLGIVGGRNHGVGRELLGRGEPALLPRQVFEGVALVGRGGG